MVKSLGERDLPPASKSSSTSAFSRMMNRISSKFFLPTPASPASEDDEDATMLRLEVPIMPKKQQNTTQPQQSNDRHSQPTLEPRHWLQRGKSGLRARTL